MLNYTTKLGTAFLDVLKYNKLIKDPEEALTPDDSPNTSSNNSNNNNNNNNSSNNNSSVLGGSAAMVRSPSTENSEDLFLSFLLSEAQGGVRVYSKLSDLELSVHDIRPIDAVQR